MENEPPPPLNETKRALSPPPSPSTASNSSLISSIPNIPVSPPPSVERRDARKGKQQHPLKVCLGTRILPYAGIILLTMTVLIHKNYIVTNLDSSSAVSEAAFQNVAVKKKEKVKVAEKPSNQKKNDIKAAKANKLPPLLLNMGRGTTGTHTFQKATCILGLPTVHWRLFCVSPTPGFDDVSLHVQNGIRSHFELKTAFIEGAFCLRGETFCDMNVVTWANALKVHARGVVDSGVVSLHDTPYTFMIPFFTQLATKIRGVPPFLILSERNEEVWAQRRLDVHGPCVILCKDFFNEDMDGDGTLVQDQDLEGFFDVMACMKRAKERRRRELQQGGDGSKLLMGDVFVHITKLQRPQGDKILAHAMKVYQDTMREKSDYAFMLFGHNKTEFNIADEIQERLSALPPTTKEGFRNVTHYGSGNLLIRRFPGEHYEPTLRAKT